MNKEDLFFYEPTDDTIDEQIHECELQLDIMEGKLCEQLGEEFEDYKSVIERYIDLIKFKNHTEGFISAGRMFLDNEKRKEPVALQELIEKQKRTL